MYTHLRVLWWVLGLCGVSLGMIGGAVAAATPVMVLPATPEAVKIGSTALVPLRPMAELLGGTLTARDGAVVLTLGPHQLTIEMDHADALADGQPVALPVPPFTHAGVTYVPLRVLVTALDGTLSQEKAHLIMAQVPTPSGPVVLHLRESAALPNIAAFTDRDMEVYLCNLDGTGLHRLTYSMEDESSPGISPDGKLLAYSYQNQLYVRALNDPTERMIAPCLNSYGDAPRFSPDGSTVLFTQNIIEGDRQYPLCWIYSVKTDGTAYRQLVEGDSPQYAPDGTFIAYLSTNLTDGTQLFRMNPDGSDVRVYGKAVSMVFSGDGNYLQYISPVSDDKFGKYVQHAITLHGKKTVPDSPPFPDEAMGTDDATTPDLSAVVFSWYPRAVKGIYLADGNRTQITCLTTNINDHAPSFTPDLSHILFLRDTDLYCMARDGSQVRSLTRGLLICSYTLMPDGEHLLLSAMPEASCYAR